MRIEPDGQVVDTAGARIPGLYAAGEVTGMLGSPGIGRGFPGSITAIYVQGRIAAAAALELD